MSVKEVVTSKKLIASAAKLATMKQQRGLNKREKKQVKNLIGRQLEKKYKDFSIAATSIDAAGTISGSINQISQVVGASGRIGDEIIVNKINISYSVACADATNFIRVIFFKWNVDNNTTAPTVAEVFAGVATNPWLAQYNQNTLEEGRMQIIFDRLHSLDLDAGPSVQSVLNKQIFGKSLKAHRVYFNDAATTGKGHYYFAFISDSAAASHPTVAVMTRMYYTDA